RVLFRSPRSSGCNCLDWNAMKVLPKSQNQLRSIFGDLQTDSVPSHNSNLQILPLSEEMPKIQDISVRYPPTIPVSCPCPGQYHTSVLHSHRTVFPHHIFLPLLCSWDYAPKALSHHNLYGNIWTDAMQPSHEKDP